MLTFLAIIGAISLVWFVSDMYYASKEVGEIRKQSIEIGEKIYNEKVKKRKELYDANYKIAFPYGEKQREIEIEAFFDRINNDLYSFNEVDEAYTRFAVDFYSLAKQNGVLDKNFLIEVIQIDSAFGEEEAIILADIISKNIQLRKMIEEKSISRDEALILIKEELNKT